MSLIYHKIKTFVLFRSAQWWEEVGRVNFPRINDSQPILISTHQFSESECTKRIFQSMSFYINCDMLLMYFVHLQLKKYCVISFWNIWIQTCFTESKSFTKMSILAKNGISSEVTSIFLLVFDISYITLTWENNIPTSS